MLEFLAVAVPAAIAVILVLATVALIFWYGAGRQSSYEDAVKARKGHAERELRKMAEKEKEQQKQKREKKRVGKSKKQDSVHSSGQEDAEATPPPPQKGILKSSRPNSVVKDKVSSNWKRTYTVLVAPLPLTNVLCTTIYADSKLSPLSC